MFYDVQSIYDPGDWSEYGPLKANCFGFLLGHATDPIDTDDSVVIMQCSGVKDKNGKLIYEGDVLEIVSVNDWNDRGVLAWDGVHARWLMKDVRRKWSDGPFDGGRSSYSGIFYSDAEIIGNIYENLDLIETEQKDCKK